MKRIVLIPAMRIETGMAHLETVESRRLTPDMITLQCVFARTAIFCCSKNPWISEFHFRLGGPAQRTRL